MLELTTRGQIREKENTFSQNTIWGALDNFIYPPGGNITFVFYFSRFEDLYATDYLNWVDSKKVHLLLRKLGTKDHTKFFNYILPRKTNELTFTETVKLLIEFFRPKTSLFRKRWKCMNLTRKDSEDYTTFASVVNKHCDDFKLSELSANNFKCLIFVQGLVSAKDAEIRRTVLNEGENEPNLALQQIAGDCQRFVSERQNSKNIEEFGIAHIRKVRQKKKQSHSPSKSNQYKNKTTRLLTVFRLWVTILV